MSLSKEFIQLVLKTKVAAYLGRYIPALQLKVASVSSVDGVLASMNKTINDLKLVQKAKELEADREAAAAIVASLRQKEAIDEAGRAAKVHARLSSLFAA